MKIVIENPPNIAAITAAFPDAIGKVIYCYGDTIFNPDDHPVGPQNVVHEKVHEEQQRILGVKIWWDRYIHEPLFRAQQELPAYRAEYLFLKERVPAKEAYEIAERFAANLAGPTYGNCINFKDAYAYILHGKD